MNRLPTRPSRRDQERGSASLEAAIGVPAFLLGTFLVAFLAGSGPFPVGFGAFLALAHGRPR